MRQPTARDPGPESTGEAPASAAARARGQARGRALMFASAVFFGLAAMLAKLAARGGMGGGQATLVRFALGLSAAVALFRLRPGTFRPVRWDLLAVRGLLGGVKEISMAKLHACDRAQRVAHDRMQLHGGMGYVLETPVARAWRDLRVVPIAGGTSEIMKEIVARAVGL